MAGFFRHRLGTLCTVHDYRVLHHHDSGSCGVRPVGVRVPPFAPTLFLFPDPCQRCLGPRRVHSRVHSCLAKCRAVAGGPPRTWAAPHQYLTGPCGRSLAPDLAGGRTPSPLHRDDPRGYGQKAAALGTTNSRLRRQHATPPLSGHRRLSERPQYQSSANQRSGIESSAFEVIA
jgi:hypothetical protein